MNVRQCHTYFYLRKFTANEMDHDASPLLKIPAIQRILRFAVKSVKLLVRLRLVSATWDETVSVYGEPVMASLLAYHKQHNILHKLARRGCAWVLELAIDSRRRQLRCAPSPSSSSLTVADVLNEEHPSGFTAAAHAAISGSVETLRVVARNGGLLDAWSGRGSVAMHAVRAGMVDTVRYILAATRSNTGAGGDGGGDAVSSGVDQDEATSSSQSRVASRVGVTNNGNNRALDPHGLSIELLAARVGNPEVLRAVLENGGDVHASSRKKHDTIGSTAARAGRVDMLRVFAEHGGSLVAPTRGNKTLISHAASGGSVATLDFLAANGCPIDSEPTPTQIWPIMAAIIERKWPAVRWFLERGVPPNRHLSPITGWTMAHYAAAKKDAALLRLLVEFGASLAQPCDQGRTPLKLATFYKVDLSWYTPPDSSPARAATSGPENDARATTSQP